DGWRETNDLKQGIHGGKIYESLESVDNIPSFVEMYNVQLDEWMGPNIHRYRCRRTLPTCRKLRPGTCPFETIDLT
ncbi:hypothetical protein EDD16DRAFT_1475188, partial [Pisolithus croceorrhizus]